MPCQDNAFDQRLYEQELAGRNKELAQMLCHACKMIEGKEAEMTPDLKSWWKQHKIEDARREREEQRKQAKIAKAKEDEIKRKALLASLSEEQRKILGFK